MCDIEDNVTRNKKCSKLAQEIRKEGNELFKSKSHNKLQHLNALLLYTKSIAYAPNNSELLASGYGNRSALLFHLKKFNHCISDIDRATAITKLTQTKIRLLLRKAECVSKGSDLLNQHEVIDKLRKTIEEAKQCVDEIDESDVQRKKDLYGYIEKTVEGIKPPVNIKNFEPRKPTKPEFGKAGEVPIASDAVELKYNEEFGRHFVATRDIETGETLIIEEGNAFPSLHLMYVTCSFCLKQIEATIPCDKCVFAMYCSEKCKKLGWKKYHEQECSDINYIFLLKHAQTYIQDDDKLVLIFMLLRRLLILALKEEDIDSIEDLISEYKEVNNCPEHRTKGFFKKSKFKGHTFKAWTSLISHSKDTEKELISDLASEFCKLLIQDLFKIDIKEKTDYQKDGDAFAKLHNFIIELFFILRVNTTVCESSNPECSCNLKENQENTKRHGDDCLARKGIVLAPYCSLLNHSCCPNVDKIFANGKMIIIATRPIKKDDQLFISYGPNLMGHRLLRQSHLSSTFFFDCKCVACTEKWPLFSSDDDEFSNDLANQFIKKYKDPQPLDVLYKDLSQEIQDIYAKETLQKAEVSTYWLKTILKNYYVRKIVDYDNELSIPDECWLNE